MKKLIALGECEKTFKALSKPCSDCPMRRDSLNGWLGGSTSDEYLNLCHSDERVECHVHSGSRCAGLAIYRTNTAKWQPEIDKLPADRVTVFGNRMEFSDHHNAFPCAKSNV